MTKVLHLKAPHDRNGNPRRLFVIITDEEMWAEDEGYEGIAGILARRGNYLREPLENATPMNITATEYRRIKKEYA